MWVLNRAACSLSKSQAPVRGVAAGRNRKSPPDIFNVLLQVMDHGTLTDNNGRKADFRNVVIIMTTNAGAESLSKSSIGFYQQQGQRRRDGRHQAPVHPGIPQPAGRHHPFKMLDEAIILRVVDKFLMQLEAQLNEKRWKSTSPTHLSRTWPNTASTRKWARGRWRG